MKRGYYKHYKGGLYYVKDFGKHTENGEEMVIYVDVKSQVWIRPESMWSELVNGKPRFEYIKNQHSKGKVPFLLQQNYYRMNK